MSKRPNQRRRGNKPQAHQGPRSYRDPGMKRFMRFFSNVSAATIGPNVSARSARRLHLAIMEAN